MKVVIFSLLLEQIKDCIDDVTYEDGLLKFYKDHTLYKTFNILNHTHTAEQVSGIPDVCEVEINKAYMLLVNKIRTYGA